MHHSGIPIFNLSCDDSERLIRAIKFVSTWQENTEIKTAGLISMPVYSDSIFPIESRLEKLLLALSFTYLKNSKTFGNTDIHQLAMLLLNLQHTLQDISSKNKPEKTQQTTTKHAIHALENLPLFPQNLTKCHSSPE